MMDANKDFIFIKEFYEKRLNSDNVLAWENKEAQFKRFQVLIDHVDINGKKLLDIGCGFGDLLCLFKEKNIKVVYTGVDLVPKIIEKAKILHPNEKFISGNLSEEDLFEKNSFEIIYASGIFNLNVGDNEDLFKDCVKRIMEFTRGKFVFNMLNIRSRDKEDPYYYYDPNIIKQFLETKYKVTIIDDYLENDFTVIIEE